MSMACLAYTMAPHQVALDQRKLLLLLLALFFSCCLHKPMQLNGESRYLLTSSRKRLQPGRRESCSQGGSRCRPPALAGVRQRPQGFCVLQRWKCGPAGRSRDGGLSPVVGHRTGLTEDLPSSQTEIVTLSSGEPADHFL